VDGEVSGVTNDFGVTLVGNDAAFGVGNPDTTIVTANAINDGVWHHVAATRDSFSGQMNLYLDGILQATGPGPPDTRSAAPRLCIGGLQTGVPGHFLAGAIDDVQLFDRVFSPAEVPTLMNHPPNLMPISAMNILAGRTLLITNTAVDVDMPAQRLTFSLQNPPSGATIISTNGLLTWRPSIAQSGATYPLTVQVADNGTPSLSAAQSFSVNVLPPVQPTIGIPFFNQGQPGLQISGNAGPDYSIYATTNLTGPWTCLLTTNPAVLPFRFVDAAATNCIEKFYRVLLGP
jgi:hypothetical protein